MPHPPEPTAPEPTNCERVAALLDALPDLLREGELSAPELALLERHTASCPLCAAEREAAEELARATVRLPRPVCPPALAARVLQQAEELAQRRPEPVLSWPDRLRLAARELPAALRRNLVLSGLARPALAAAAAAVVAVVLVVSQTKPAPRTYSPEEIAKAQAELQLALAYLGRMGNETSAAVQQEVVEHVIAPTFRVLSPGGASPEGSH